VPAAFAGVNDVAIEAETMSWPTGAGQTAFDSAAPDGQALHLTSSAKGTATITTAVPSVRVAVTARGHSCKGAPLLNVQVDGIDATVDGRSANPFGVPDGGSYAELAGDVAVPAGPHTVTIEFPNYYEDTLPFLGCTRDVWIDTLTINGQPFAASSFRNQQLSPTAPLDANSADLVAKLVQIEQTYGEWVNTRVWTTPVYTVAAGFPTTLVSLDACHMLDASNCDLALQSRLEAVPLPSWTQLSTDPDSEVVVYQPSTDRLWEFLGLRKDLLGNWTAIHAGYTGEVSRSSARWPSQWWGASGSKIPMLMGLQRIAETQAAVRGTGSIDHPLMVALPAVRDKFASAAGAPCPYPAVPPGGNSNYPWPAQNSDGSALGPNNRGQSTTWMTDCTGIPEGTRFRFPTSLNIDTLSPPLSPYAKAVAKAIQRYGLIVTDRSTPDLPNGSIGFYGERPQDLARGAYDPWSDGATGIFGGALPDGVNCASAKPGAFCNFPWSKLQVVAVPPVAAQQ
jgi:hypothetical protein